MENLLKDILKAVDAYVKRRSNWLKNYQKNFFTVFVIARADSKRNQHGMETTHKEVWTLPFGD